MFTILRTVNNNSGEYKMTNEKIYGPFERLPEKIKFTGPQDNGKNLGHKKEVVHARELIVFDGQTMKSIAVARWYMGKSNGANKVDCSIWVYTPVFGQYTAGNGSSSGFGFCKHSDAFERALHSAGIYSSVPISGRGMSEVDTFLEELGKQAGFKHVYVAKG